MKIKSIGYRLTTFDVFKCHKCREVIDGKEGYILIEGKNKENPPFIMSSIIRICWPCFAKIWSEANVKRKTRFDDYNKLLKQRILTKLR